MKKTLITLLVCLVALAGNSYANLLSNGDFESPGDTGSISDTAVDSWTAWGGSGWINDDIAGAGIGIKFWSSDSGIYQDFNCTAGLGYDFSVGAYTRSGNEPLTAGAGNLTVEWFDASDNQLSANVLDQFVSSDSQDQWVTLSGTMLADPGASYGRFVLSEAADSAGSVYFDNASVVAVPEPVSAALLGIGIGFIYMLRKKIRS